MRHRRYPVKKTTKIKASDPLSKGKGGGKKVDLKKKNRPPTLDEIDHQMVPRRLKEIEEAKNNELNGEGKKKKKKRNKNKFLELTAKMGFQQRPWEDNQQLMKRIMRTKNKALDDEMIKVKAGTAGRDVKELEKEFDETE
ncbi:unnamed protein product [Bursaphelenchus okinawaensis]|uniref:Uncharacterized protein n=1 Tax=Bursaphelenchus okinawaensis TaxID=465554 RepID=A0A811KUF0_9BILA|nr:unnamed protein product [Bursaphelenchus okinawaensis]CAG9112320.1 unnamed protein product [Bursaphelenchus okinawaensis]